MIQERSLGETVLVSPSSVAERSRLSLAAIYHYINRGVLPVVPVMGRGGRFLIEEKDARAFVERREVVTGGKR